MSLRVLLVDDLPEVRTLLRSALRLRAGMEIVGEATTSTAAAAQAAELHPDVVVLDSHLPDAAGQDAYQRVHAAAPTACVVIYSAYDSDEGWYRHHGVRFVSKDPDITGLIKAITAGQPCTGPGPAQAS
jgi:DNA-binding NarL/FixJ family response regulator